MLLENMALDAPPHTKSILLLSVNELLATIVGRVELLPPSNSVKPSDHMELAEK